MSRGKRGGRKHRRRMEENSIANNANMSPEAKREILKRKDMERMWNSNRFARVIGHDHSKL